MTKTVWKTIPNTNKLYLVSTEGQVKRHGSKKILKTPIMNTGYNQVSFSMKGIKTNYTVHTLVMLAFAGPRKQGQEIDHINGKRNDDRLKNLRYCTHSENMLYAYRERGVKVNQGSKHGLAKMNEHIIVKIKKMLNKGTKQKEIAKKFGVDASQISRIKSGLRWRHV